MRKSLLIAIIILSSTSSFGQKIRFSDTTNQWTFYTASVWPGSGVVYGAESTSLIGDTIIDGISYHKMNNDRLAIREDTVTKKVFIREYFGYDTAEHVLYDYNWVIGDTVTGFCNDDIRAGNEDAFWVYYIDSTDINGIWYRVWHFEGICPCSHRSGLSYYNVIEGVGCTNGVDYPIIANGEVPFCEQLFCFKNKGMSYPLSNPVVSFRLFESDSDYFDNSVSCSITLNTLPISQKNQTTELFPNPINESSKIVFPYNISSGSVVIFNDVGQVVADMPVKDKEEVLIGDRINTPGIYFYRVIDNQNGKVFSGKFVY